MKIVIGDIHSRTGWKDFINEDFEAFYFVGDYFDDYKKTNHLEQIWNFKEICDWARKDSRVKLCLGNHDFHYLKGIDIFEKYSGFQNYGYLNIQEMIEYNMDLLKIVYVDSDTIISHAGVTSTFMLENNIEKPEEINRLFLENRMSLGIKGENAYGDDPSNGPLWVRPDSLLKDKIPGYKQVVGHTFFEKITTIDGITFTDIGTCKEVYRF